LLPRAVFWAAWSFFDKAAVGQATLAAAMVKATLSSGSDRDNEEAGGRLAPAVELNALGTNGIGSLLSP
jgi:hypothetical protein